MDENRKDYSDFFKNQEEKGETTRSGNQAEKPSYYYSYGPYKSSMQEDGSRGDGTTAYSASEGSSEVEVSAPRAVRPFTYGYGGQEPQVPAASTGGWQASVPSKRSGARTMFAAFMAGAVLVGSLMFASDRMDLFSGGSSGNNGSGGSGSMPASSSGSSAGIKGAAFDMARPGNISSIVQQSSNAVVKIDTYVKAKARSNSGNSLFNDPFFRYFFGDEQQPRASQPKTESRQQAGMGTGFIFEKSGYILTNQHVVDSSEDIEVTVNGYDKPFKATLLGNSYELDLAVLKIENSKDFPVLSIGDSNQMQVGDWVVAIGNPYGFDHTVTVGVLSARERGISIPDQQGTRNYRHLLQTDASINPGNSGGPLLNMNGEVIGINTAVNAQAQGIGFAIPTSTISEVLDKLKNNVKIPKEPVPYIGANLISLKDIDKSWLKELKIEGTDGALVEDVLFGTPAFKAGLKKYDVITSIDGGAVKTKEELVSKITSKKAGDKAAFGIIRDGKKADLEIIIGDKNEYLQQQQKQQ